MFPAPDATTFVWTRDPEARPQREGMEYIDGDPEEVLATLESKGFSTCVLTGGTTTNNTFFSAGLVDEILADIHPLLLGGGMSAITLPQFEEKLKLVGHKDIGDGVVQIHYRVRTA